MTLREDLAGDIRELDCYTPDYFREKWDHDGIIARLDRVHEALLDVVEASRALLELKDGPRGSLYHAKKPAAWNHLRDVLDRLEEDHG